MFQPGTTLLLLLDFDVFVIAAVTARFSKANAVESLARARHGPTTHC